MKSIMFVIVPLALLVQAVAPLPFKLATLLLCGLV